MTHHPHIHMIVPGGGVSPDGTEWIACRPGFFLPVRVLSRLFRRLFIEKLAVAHETERLKFFAEHAGLAEPAAFATFLAPMRKSEWVVYATSAAASALPCFWIARPIVPWPRTFAASRCIWRRAG